MLTYPYTEGQTVTYHGSVTERHGRTYRAWLCPCRRAHPVEQPRFMLTDPDTGRAKAWHVRPTSLNPQTAATVPDGVAPPTSPQADR